MLLTRREQREQRRRAMKDLPAIIFALIVLGVLAAGMVGSEVRDEVVQFPCGSANE